MSNSQILISRYCEIIQRKQSRISLSDSMRVLRRDINLAYKDKPMPLEIRALLDEVENQIC